MYKLLVVDDERIIVDGISRAIDWSRIGIEVAGTARNGIEALERVQQLKPDIVISDIRMPGLDGLQFIEQALADYPELRFILLSGFGEFEYARKAMQFGVRHYLLKPCSEHAIIEAVLEVAGELSMRTSHEQLVERVQSELVKVLPHAGDATFSDLDEMPELKAYMISAAAEALRKQQEASKGKYSQVIGKVLDIIEDEIANPELSLHMVATDMLFMNADYLGKLFKQEVGDKFSAYVMKRRMEKAIVLIEQAEDVKVFELAEQLGFADNPQYFSQVFKKYTGYTPTEFKKLRG